MVRVRILSYNKNVRVNNWNGPKKPPRPRSCMSCTASRQASRQASMQRGKQDMQARQTGTQRGRQASKQKGFIQHATSLLHSACHSLLRRWLPIHFSALIWLARRVLLLRRDIFRSEWPPAPKEEGTNTPVPRIPFRVLRRAAWPCAHGAHC